MFTSDREERLVRTRTDNCRRVVGRNKCLDIDE